MAAASSTPEPDQPKPTKKAKDKKPVSDRKRDANRKNAEKSTGPTSEAGKQRCKFNGLKHGLCAQTVLLPGDDHQAYRDRLQGWLEDLKPRTRPERYLVEKLVDTSWRLDRCARTETAALAKLARDAAADADAKAQDDLAALTAALADDPARVSPRLRDTAAGCRWVHHRLVYLVSSLQRRGWWYASERDHALNLLGRRAEDAFGPDAVAADVFEAHLVSAWPHPPWRAHDLHWFLGAQKPAAMGDHEFRWRIGRAAPPKLRNPAPTAEEQARPGYDPPPEYRPGDDPSLRFDQAYAVCELVALLQAEEARLEARAPALDAAEALDRSEAAARAGCDVSAGGQTRLRYEVARRRDFYAALAALKGEQAKAGRGDEVLDALPSESPQPPAAPPAVGVYPAATPAQPAELRLGFVPPSGPTGPVMVGPMVVPGMRFRSPEHRPPERSDAPSGWRICPAYEAAGLSDASEWVQEVHGALWKSGDGPRPIRTG